VPDFVSRLALARSLSLKAMVPKLRLVPSSGEAPAAPETPDAELYQRLVRGEPRAAVLAWRAYAVMVRGLVVRSLGPDAEVEDRVQDVFAVFFRKVSTLKDPNALRSFLFGITLHEIQAELRRRRVRSWLRLTSTGEPMETVASGDENARHAFERLQRMLQSLDTRGHLAFVLRHFEGYELVEVAEALSWSLATVKRVLAAVETRVWSLAAQDPYLAPYLEPESTES
jgi:RNA polymerase sigma-70 factor (ECF subfamily)